MRARLGRDVTLFLVTAFVISRLDYCNCVLAGLPVTTVALLQRVLHTAAPLVNGPRQHDHVTLALKEQHWLPIKERVDYKLCLLVHKVTVRQVPSYLTGMLTAVTEVPSLSTLHDVSNGNYVIPRTHLKFGETAFSVAVLGQFKCARPKSIIRCSTEQITYTYGYFNKNVCFAKHNNC